MSRSQFSYTRDQLIALSQIVIEHAARQGATAADTEISEGVGQNVSVRQGEIETIEYNKDKGAGVTVYIGQRRGHASTSDLSEAALKSAVEKALTIARYTAEDDAAGLPDADRLAKDVPDLDLYHPWPLSVEEAAERAKACEAAALAVDKRLTNSEGAGVSLHTSQFIYANSLGFCNGYAGSRHGMSVAVIGEDKGAMQRDYWYTSARNANDLDSAESVGRIAGTRTVRRLNGKQTRHPHLPGAVRGADRHRPDRQLRRRGLRQQPLPQVVVPARQPGPAGVRPAGAPSASSPSFPAASAARPSTAKASPASTATSSRTACCRAISCRPTRRKSSA